MEVQLEKQHQHYGLKCFSESLDAMILQKVLGSPGIIHFKAKSSFCLHDFSCYIFRLQMWVDALLRDCWEALSSLVCLSVHPTSPLIGILWYFRPYRPYTFWKLMTSTDLLAFWPLTHSDPPDGRTYQTHPEPRLDHLWRSTLYIQTRYFLKPHGTHIPLTVGACYCNILKELLAEEMSPNNSLQTYFV